MVLVLIFRFLPFHRVTLVYLWQVSHQRSVSTKYNSWQTSFQTLQCESLNAKCILWYKMLPIKSPAQDRWCRILSLRHIWTRNRVFTQQELSQHPGMWYKQHETVQVSVMALMQKVRCCTHWLGFTNRQSAKLTSCKPASPRLNNRAETIASVALTSD